ncbi:restriction endonuclease subunit S [Methanothrix soehngenii]
MPEKKKSVVPCLRFPEFRNAGEWEVKQLGVVAEFFKGKNIAKSDISPKGKTFCIRYGELYTLYQEVIVTIEPRTNLSHEELFLSLRNDVLIPSSGETKEDIAKASCVLLDGVALGGDINVIRSTQNGIFLSYYLNSSKRGEIAKIAQGDSVVHLYANQLKQLYISIPILPEQQKIADCLSSLDVVIDLEAQKLKALKAHKKGLMQQLFPREGETTPRLRFPKFRNAGEWEVKQLGEISNRIVEKVGDKELVPVSITAGTGFVSQVEKFGRNISGKQYKNYVRLRKRQFSYNKGNSKVYPQGCIYQLHEFEEAAVPNAFYSFEFIKDYIPEFFKGYFELNYHGKQLAKYITSGARSDGLLNISADDFFSIILPTPVKREEQQKIAGCLSSLDEVINLQIQKLDALKAHKKGLMQQLFPQELD